MRLRLLLRIFCLSLPIATWFGFAVFREDPTHYARAVRIKGLRLMDAGDSRIILAGGSNIALSVDSGRIEKELHHPTLNMGVHAALGLRFMLAQIEPFLRTGDLVAIVPENEQFYSVLDGTEELAGMLIVDPEQWRYLRRV